MIELWSNNPCRGTPQFRTIVAYQRDGSAHRQTDPESQPYDGDHAEHPENQSSQALNAGLYTSRVVLHAPARRQNLQDRAVTGGFDAHQKRKEKQGAC